MGSAAVALDPQEAMFQQTALQVILELLAVKMGKVATQRR
jgi:hypothetical protein